MTAENSTDAPKTRRWVKILLVLSLAMNLLIIGLVVGVVSERRLGGGDDIARVALRDIAYSPYARALSRGDRKIIGEMMRKELGADRENIPKLRENYRDLLQVLRAATYDDAKARRLIDEQQAFVVNRQQLGQRLMLERLNAMTPKQRKQFAKRLERVLARLRSRG